MDTIYIIGITLIAIYVILWLYNIWATYRLFHTPMNEGGLADEDGKLASGFIMQPSIFVLMFVALWLPCTTLWISGIWWSLFPPQLPKWSDTGPAISDPPAIILPKPLPPHISDDSPDAF